MGQFNTNAVTHSGSGGWGFSGGVKPTLISAMAVSSTMTYQFDDLFRALRQLDGRPPAACVDLNDPKSPLSVAVKNICADPQRAASDLAGLLTEGGHVVVSAIGLVLAQCKARDLSLKSFGANAVLLRRAILARLVESLNHYTLGGHLGVHAKRCGIATVFSAKLRMIFLRFFGASERVSVELEGLGWGLQAISFLSSSPDERAVLFCSLRETAALAQLLRELPARGVGQSTHLTAEFRACEALASGLEALGDEERAGFCREYLFVG
jgi:hypothetical protein